MVKLVQIGLCFFPPMRNFTEHVHCQRMLRVPTFFHRIKKCILNLIDTGIPYLDEPVVVWQTITDWNPQIMRHATTGLGIYWWQATCHVRL
ncbi:MAG TPA: hypothetical protein DHV59_01560 [Oxalobacteraceae bacterium]|nr:hypothetical protein [Oxalobacteraceae bacterium]